MSKAYAFLIAAILMATFAGLGYQAYQLNHLRSNKNVAASATSKTIVRSPADKQVDVVTLAQLAKENLMGNPSKWVGKSVKQEQAPAVPLRLTLMGTITTTGEGRASAFIQSSSKDTKRYYVGEMIENGAVLDSVSVDSVVIKRSGQTEVLRYPVAGSTAQSGAGNVRPAVQNRVAPAKAQQQNNAGAPVNNNANNKMLSLRERLKKAPVKTPQENSSGQ